MSKKPDIIPPIRNYFVDEAGDPVLFGGKRGDIIVGTEGCSRFFMLGLLDVPDHAALSKDLIELRLRLMADPYFKDVPSFDPQRKKTALAFHAKDDLPEVRREVFGLLRKYSDLQFYAVVVDKLGYANHVKHRNTQSPAYRYNPNDLYDLLTKRLFNDKLHKSDEYNICFARRGRTDRTVALRLALIEARQRFCKRWKIEPQSTLNMTASDPIQTACLQAVDYFLWAIQRLYEKREDRYLAYLWPSFKLVIDINDMRKAAYGMYYSQKTPLTLAALEGRL